MVPRSLSSRHGRASPGPCPWTSFLWGISEMILRLSHLPKGGALSWANSVTATASPFREVVPSPPGAGLSSLLPENLANGSSQGLSPSPQLCMDVAFAPPSRLALPRTLPWQFGCCMPRTLSLDRLHSSWGLVFRISPAHTTVRFTAPFCTRR